MNNDATTHARDRLDIDGMTVADMTVQTTKVDKRHRNPAERQYHRTVQLTVRYYLPTSDSVATLLTLLNFDTLQLWERIKPHVGGLMMAGNIGRAIRAEHERWGRNYPGYPNMRGGWLTIKLRTVAAERPSLIPTEAEVLAQLNVNACFAAICAEFEANAVAHAHALRKARRACDANSILSQVRRELNKKAKAACRYEQRLAALTAELQAELELQAATMARELRAEGVQLEQSDGGIVEADPEVVEAVIANLPKTIAGLASARSHFGGLDFGIDPVQPDDVGDADTSD